MLSGCGTVRLLELMSRVSHSPDSRDTRGGHADDLQVPAGSYRHQPIGGTAAGRQNDVLIIAVIITTYHRTTMRCVVIMNLRKLQSDFGE